LNKRFNFGVIKEIEENQPSLNFKNKEKNGANPKTLPYAYYRNTFYQFQRR
jgi:hypothetical protein